MVTEQREFGPPRHTTAEERERMARASRQRYRELRLRRLEDMRDREKAKRRRKHYCTVCDEKTSHGCPDCRAYVCNPWERDCWESHRQATHG